ncbi:MULTISPECIES: hypothetical protein [unclassified Mesorhizobium]|uniref:hypothetical protein n=1 Tax=unclassified Mesorhizobium TaxID=325217 RepID=UPI00333AFAD5
MLHHASFNARDPQAVASVLAEMLVATAVRAPSPPFPEGAWFVCLGDDFGSLIEILPCGTVLDQQAPLGIGFDPNMRLRSGSHVLLSTPNSTETIQGIAARMGWHSELIDARLFKVLKVWVEDETLVEFLTPEVAPLYRARFGWGGMATLDAKLRELESQMAAALAAKAANQSGRKDEQPAGAMSP